MSYLDLGFDSLLNRSSSGADGSFATEDGTGVGTASTDSVYNSEEDTIDPSQILSGSIASQLTIDRDGHIKGGATDYLIGDGFWIGSYSGSLTDYRFFIGDSGGNYLSYANGVLTVVGAVSISAGGTIGGFDVGADYVRDAANSMGLASTATGSDDVRFWAGDTFANRATAPFRVYESGAVVATSATITIASLGGFDIGSDYIRDTANSMGLASTISGSDDVRFWAGGTFANRATAPARIYESGAAVFTSSTVNGSTLSFQDAFGDSSDGAATISGNTSLSRDMFYTNLTIDSGVTLDCAGFRVHCSGTLTVNGTIGRAGNAGGAGGNTTTATGGTAGTAGAALASGSMNGTVAGVAGATGGAGSTRSTNGLNSNDNDVAGTAGNDVVKSLTSANGTAGGASSDSVQMSTSVGTITSGVGSSGGTFGTTSGTVFNIPKTAMAAWMLYDFFPSGDSLRSSAGSGSGASGSGGGCERAGTGTCTVTGTGGGGGGGSGSPGGIVAIFARTISISASGTITAKGGAGGNGGNSGDGIITGTTTGDQNAQAGGAGGGGAGGSGGCVILVYSVISNAGTITSAGGTGGTGGTHGRNNVSGVYTDPTGSSGSNGADGNAGLTVQLIV